MRRFLIRTLAAVGVLAALLATDVSPRAAAGYVSVGGPPASASFGADVYPTPSPDPSPIAHRLAQKYGLPVALPQQSGGMAPTGSSTGGVDGPPSGFVSRAETPADRMSVYFREPEAVLNLSRFIDSILDPPRGF